MLDSTARISIVSPFPDAHLPAVWGWIAPFKDRIFDDFCPRTQNDFVKWHQQRSRLPGRQTYGVKRGGELGGLVVIERYLPEHPSAVAHLLFRKSFWGRKTTVPALTEIFEDTFGRGVLTLRSEVFQDNNAIISLIEGMGGVRYGIPKVERGKALADPIPNSTLRNGEPLGMVGLVLTPEGFAHALSRTIRTSPDRRRGRVGVDAAGPAGSEADRDVAVGPGSQPGTTSPAIHPDRAGDTGPGRAAGSERGIPGLPQPSGDERQPGDGSIEKTP